MMWTWWCKLNKENLDSGIGLFWLLWNRLLVRLDLRTDWSNPHNAPPGLSDDEEPHHFSHFDGVSCCGRCGGGRLHSVHQGVPFHRIRKPVKLSEVRSGEGDDT